jgi:hypothetical protein
LQGTREPERRASGSLKLTRAIRFQGTSVDFSVFVFCFFLVPIALVPLGRLSGFTFSNTLGFSGMSSFASFFFAAPLCEPKTRLRLCFQ